MRLFKFESILLIFNNNEIINVINTNFNVLKFDVFHSKTCEIKELIVNSHLTPLSTRCNALKGFKASPLKLIASLASSSNTQIPNPN